MSTVAPKTFSDLLACEAHYVGIDMTILSFPWPFGRLIADIFGRWKGVPAWQMDVQGCLRIASSYTVPALVSNPSALSVPIQGLNFLRINCS